MIDPLETVIQYLKSAGLSTSQIASKQRYGEAWAPGTPSVVVNLDEGEADIYLPVQNPRLEVRCYGASRPAAAKLMNEIITLSRQTERVLVTTHNGEGLLYFLLQASGMSLLFDETVNLDFAVQFYDAKISEIGV